MHVNTEMQERFYQVVTGQYESSIDELKWMQIDAEEIIIVDIEDTDGQPKRCYADFFLDLPSDSMAVKVYNYKFELIGTEWSHGTDTMTALMLISAQVRYGKMTDVHSVSRPIFEFMRSK